MLLSLAVLSSACVSMSVCCMCICAHCVNVCMCMFTGGHSSSDPLVREVVRVQTALGDKGKQADGHQQPQPSRSQRTDAGRYRQLR